MDKKVVVINSQPTVVPIIKTAPATTTAVYSENVTIEKNVNKTVDVFNPAIGYGYGRNPNNPFTSDKEPGKPLSVIVEEGFGFVRFNLTMVKPYNFRYLEVFRASIDNVAMAQSVGFTETSTFTDVISPSEGYYYWFRMVTFSNTSGEWYSSSGTYAEGGKQGLSYINALNGLISEALLSPDFLDRLNAIDVFITGLQASANELSTRIGTEEFSREASILSVETRFSSLLEESLNNERGLRTAALSEEALIRLDQYNALALTLDTLSAQLNTEGAERSASIQTEQQARISSFEALASQITQLAAHITDEQSARTAAIASEQTARVEWDEAFATQLDSLTASLVAGTSNLQAQLTTEVTARTTRTDSLAQEISNLLATYQSDIADISARVTQEESTRSSNHLALAQSVEALTAEFATESSNTAAALTQEAQARAAADSAITATVDTLTAQVNSNHEEVSAAITNESIARVALEEAFAEQTTDLAVSAQYAKEVNLLNDGSFTKPLGEEWEDTTGASLVMDSELGEQCIQLSSRGTNYGVNTQGTAKAVNGTSFVLSGMIYVSTDYDGEHFQFMEKTFTESGDIAEKNWSSYFSSNGLARGVWLPFTSQLGIDSTDAATTSIRLYQPSTATTGYVRVARLKWDYATDWETGISGNDKPESGADVTATSEAHTGLVTRVTATENGIAANAADTTKLTSRLAIAEEAGYIFPNPNFSEWSDTSARPSGYNMWSGTNPLRVTSPTSAGVYAVKFSTDATNQMGLSIPPQYTGLNAEYLEVELDVYLEYGSFSGAGLLIDWRYSGGSSRTTIDCNDLLDSSLKDTWQTLSVIIKKPHNNQLTEISGYLMANYPHISPLATKIIYFGRLAVKPASQAAVESWLNAEAINSLETSVSSLGTTQSAQAGQISSINTSLEGKATTGALNSLTSTVNSVNGVVTGHTQQLTQLEASRQGVNLIPSEYADPTATDTLPDIWKTSNITLTPFTHTVDTFALNGRLRVIRTRSTATNAYIFIDNGDDVEANRIPVVPGETYIFSAYVRFPNTAAKATSNLQLYLRKYDESGAYLDYDGNTHSLSIGAVHRPFYKWTCPTGTHSVRLRIDHEGFQDNGDPYLDLACFQFEHAGAGQTEPSAWGPGTFQASIAQQMRIDLEKAMAAYSMKLDNNGFVTSLSLTNDGSTSAFKVKSSNFGFYDDNGNLVMGSTSGTKVINGSAVKDNTIPSVAIQSLEANKVNASTLSAITANLGTCTAGVVRSSDSNFVINLNNKTMLLRKSTSGQRTEYRDTGVKVYDSSGTLRVALGVL